MAQRTGAERFLAPRPKVASARAILALAALAALALAGCGGGGEDGSTTASAPSAPSAQSAAEKQAGSAPTSSSPSSPSSPATGKDASKASNPTAPTQSPGPGAKHGPSIVVPKGEPERGPTPKEAAELTVADIAIWSPSLGTSQTLPAPYTCDGNDSWPELRWSGIPTDTKELAILAMSSQPAQGKLVFDWALAGLDPRLEGIEEGKLPKGAVTGQNSFGHNAYEICPPSAETYVFALFALPKALSPKQGFDPRAFHEEVLGVSGNAGLLAVSYARG
jgi:phosphatidylethanolamine-binding protein (PEBP) family uncharacterized protein